MALDQDWPQTVVPDDEPGATFGKGLDALEKHIPAIRDRMAPIEQKNLYAALAVLRAAVPAAAPATAPPNSAARRFRTKFKHGCGCLPLNCCN